MNMLWSSLIPHTREFEFSWHILDRFSIAKSEVTLIVISSNNQGTNIIRTYIRVAGSTVTAKVNDVKVTEDAHDHFGMIRRAHSVYGSICHRPNQIEHSKQDLHDRFERFISGWLTKPKVTSRLFTIPHTVQVVTSYFYTDWPTLTFIGSR